MRVFLGSGGFRTPERVQILVEQMRSFFGPVERLLFVPHAGSDHDAYVRLLHDRGLNAGYVVEQYERYLRDPASVSPQTRAWFARLGAGRAA